MGLTEQQRKMMRHMLGLPNARNVSYRNHYFAPPGGPASVDLSVLHKAGLADTEADGGSVFGWLTRKGAELVLERGERLCPEDFPPSATQVAEAA